MEKNQLRFLQSKAEWSPIKFYIDYTYLDNQKINATKVTFTKKIIERAINVFNNLLTIQRINPIIKLKECGEEIPPLYINNQLKTTGVMADIIIFPFFDLQSEASTEAYAGPCSMDPNTKRPNAGMIGFNPENFILDNKNALEYYTYLVLHEMTHILALNADLFESFVDSNYNSIAITKIITNTTVNGSPKQMIITPKVKAVAQQHFGCNSLLGVEIEDQGGVGTAGSHWESRVMLGDYMMGESYGENIISEISLALFEDSGWYKVNFYTAGLFRYGKNKGCSFVQNKCINNGQTNFPTDFCTEPNAPICFSSKSAKGACQLDSVTDASIPIPYRYFSDPKKGGYTNADYCPLANSYGDDINSSFFSSSCFYGVNDFPDLGETIGEDSVCFVSSLVPSSNQNLIIFKGSNRAICHNIKCNSVDQTYSVKIMNTTLICNKEGGVKTIKDYDGSFYCPDYFSVCTRTASCSDSIDCALKKVVYTFPQLNYGIGTSANVPQTSGNEPNENTQKSTIKMSQNYITFDSLKYLVLLSFAYLFL